MARKKPIQLGGDTPFVWDNTTVLAPGCEMTIVATPEEFRAVAVYLLGTAAMRWPDDRLRDDTNSPINDGFDEDLRNSIHRIARQLLTQTINCGVHMGYQLRQNPANDCQLQQYIDGSWVLAFDYSLCLSGLVETVNGISNDQKGIEIVGSVPAIESEYQDFTDRYEGTSASYDADLTNVGGINQGAICEAVRDVVRQSVHTSKEYKNDEAEDLSRASLALGLGIAVVGALAIIISGGLAGPALAALWGAYITAGTAAAASAAAGISMAALAVWAQAVKDAAAELFDDEAAINEVICIWYNQLRFDEDISLADFQAPVDMSEGTGDTEALWTAIQALAQQDIMYVGFLKAWKRALQFSEAGVETDCGCEDVPDVNLIIYDGQGDSITYLGRTGEGIDKYHVVCEFYPGSGGRVAAVASTGGLFRVVEINTIEGNWRASYCSREDGAFTIRTDEGHVVSELEGFDYYVVQYQTPDFESGPASFDIFVSLPLP
jgi:hypothetical protein